MRQKVMTLAHQIKEFFTNFSEALKFAWKKVKLQIKLASGITYFQFKKKSTGELRDVIATTKDENRPDYTFKGGRAAKWYIVKFVDTTIREWRSCDARTITNIYW